MSIGKELARKAKQKGICQEWHTELKSIEDKEKLVEMYIRGIDFCLANDYPSNDYIRKNFVGFMEKYGVHLDEEIRILNERKVIALGKCTGNVEVSDYTTCEVFMKHESELSIMVKDNAFVMVDLFDDSTLVIAASGNSKVVVNRYGGKVEFEAYQNSVVKIKEKNQKTY
jgi:hypothetical protein